MTSKKKESQTGTALLLAGLTVAGAVAGYFLYGPHGKANRTKIKSWSLKAKAEVLERLEKAKEVSEETYAKIVDEVTSRYEHRKGIEAADVENLKKELKKYWKTIQKEMKGVSKKVKKTVAGKKKTTSSAPRSIMRS